MLTVYPGAAVSIAARFTIAPSTVRCLVSRDGEPAVSVPLAQDEEDALRYAGTFTPTDPGRYYVRVESDGAVEGVTEGQLVVRPSGVPG
jgi:hypothetical protein